MTAGDLRERIEKSWQELVDVASATGLDAQGPDGWTVKDHLVHVAAWEHSLLGLVEGRDRLAAMGIHQLLEENTDAVNDAVWKMHRDSPPEEALRYFRESHAQMMQALGKLSDADLQMPYSHFQPDDPEESRPVFGWVEGNTYGHYEEHIGWIKALAPAPR
jgi:hypothetical protein